MLGPQLNVGIYGENGHQIQHELARRNDCAVVAVAAISDESLPSAFAGTTRYATLDQMLADARVQVVSLCSPRRADQARDAIRCLGAGKHVYAEKPAAMVESDIDQ